MADAETRTVLAGLIALYDGQKRGRAMKTMGLLAGMSWESSSVYYQLINRGIQQRLGGVHSAKVLMYSFDFGEISRLQQAARWDEATALLSGVGQTLAKGGADFLAICCNTMHLMADDVQRAAGIRLASYRRSAGRGGPESRHDQARPDRHPLHHGRAAHHRRPFAREIRPGSDPCPDAAGRETIDSIIQTELVKGIIRDESRARYRAVMAKLVEAGLPSHRPGLHGNPACW